MYHHTPSFQVEGIASGLQTQKLVEAASSRHDPPLKQALRRYDSNIYQTGCLKDVKTSIESLDKIIDTYQDQSKIAPPMVTSDAPTEVSGTAKEGAVLGAYRLKVMSVATAQRSYSEPWPTRKKPPPPEKEKEGEKKEIYVPEEELAAGTFTLTLGSGRSFSTRVGGEVDQATLAALVTGAGLSISAQVVDERHQDPPQQSLMFAALANGENFTFDISTTYDSPQKAGTRAVDFRACDAAGGQLSRIHIDGRTAQGRPYYSLSSTRDFPDVLPGIDLRLGEHTAPGTVATLLVEVDRSNIATVVNDFLSAYNGLLETLYRVTRPPLHARPPRNEVEAREQARQRERTFRADRGGKDPSGFDSKKDVVSLLRSLLGDGKEDRPEGVVGLERDTFVRSLYERLRYTLSVPVEGAHGFCCLRDIGFRDELDENGTANPSGAQVIDHATFTRAVNAAPEAVATLLVGSALGPAKGVFQLFRDLLAPLGGKDDEDKPLPVRMHLYRLILQAQDEGRLLEAEVQEKHEQKQRFAIGYGRKLIEMEKRKGQHDVTLDYLKQVTTQGRKEG